MSSPDRGQRSTHYEFQVRGHLGQTLLRAFPTLRAQTCGEDTLLWGAIPDQAALHGVLAGFEALGLELIELHRLPDGMAAGDESP